MEAVNTYQLSNNKTLKVYYDENPDTPRSWDNVCKMVFIGKYSNLGDKHELHATQESFEAHQQLVAKELDAAYIAPIYAYVHSGMTISTKPFSCGWDSGKLGWVVITKQTLRDEFNVKRVTKKAIEKAMVHVTAEVELLDQYVQGEVYGFKVVDAEGNEIDSCWGYYGSDIKENGILDNLNEEDRKLVTEQI